MTDEEAFSDLLGDAADDIESTVEDLARIESEARRKRPDLARTLAGRISALSTIARALRSEALRMTITAPEVA